MCIAPGTNQIDLPKWLEHHHRVEPPSNRTHGEEIHVFAIKVGDVYSTSPYAENCYKTGFNLGTVVFTIDLCFYPDSGKLSVCAYRDIPFVPTIKLGCVDGSLDEGVTLEFDLAVISGSFNFHVKDGWLWLRYDVSVIGKHWKGDIKLIPIPF